MHEPLESERHTSAGVVWVTGAMLALAVGSIVARVEQFDTPSVVDGASYFIRDQLDMTNAHRSLETPPLSAPTEGYMHVFAEMLAPGVSCAGVVVDESRIITAAHCLLDAQQQYADLYGEAVALEDVRFQAQYANGLRTLTVRPTRTDIAPTADSIGDFAVMTSVIGRFEIAGMQPAIIQDASDIDVGDTLYTVADGNPAYLQGGVVVELENGVATLVIDGKKEGAACQPGDSGGPVVTSNMQLAGVVSRFVDDELTPAETIDYGLERGAVGRVDACWITLVDQQDLSAA